MKNGLKKPLFQLLPFWAVTGVFFLLPLALIVIYSFLQAGSNGGVIWHFSWDAYVQIFYARDFDGTLVFDAGTLEIFWRSLKLAGLCTVLCLALGFPTAWHIATRAPERRNMWIMLMTIPFWTNLLIRTYAWMLILRTDGLANTLLEKAHITNQPLTLLYNDFSVGLGLLYSYLPFMILPIYANLERMDWKLVEAAHDLYATRAQVLRRIILPLCMPGIVAGCVLVFIPAIGSFLAPDLLGGGQRMMIGTLIASQFSFARNWPFGAAASVVLMAVVMAGLMIVARRGRGLQSLT